MNPREDDQDTLQIFDELNEEWVERWRKATKQKTTKTKDYCQFVCPQDETKPEIELEKTLP